MEKQFVTFEIAKDLKELGFDECCLAVYFKDKFQLVKGFNINNVDLHVANEFGGILAPLWQQVFDWVLDFDRGNLCIVIDEIPYRACEPKYFFIIKRHGYTIFESKNYYFDKDKVREKSVLKAIELIKKSNEKNKIHVKA